MRRFIIDDEDFVHLPEIIRRIRYSLRNNRGFSLVRIGDAENQVMAQGTIYTEEMIKDIWWAQDENWTGVTLPNYDARDQLIDSLRVADLVGVLSQDEEYIWKPLTEEVFSLYGIKPKQICYAFINTYFGTHPEMIGFMQHNRVLLIGKPSNRFAGFLKSRYNINVVGSIAINNYSEIPWVLEKASRIDFNFALISAGTNAVILATALAKQGKVALDIGRVMNPEFWAPRTEWS